MMLTTIPVVASRADRRAPPEEQRSDWKSGPETTDGARLWTMAARGGEETFAVREPAVARAPGASAHPLFSLTLTLARQPAPDEQSIVPLVRGGACTMTLDVSATESELAAAFPNRAPSPLFVRGASFALVRAEDGRRIAEGATGGFGGRVVLRPTLATEDAVACLRALRGEPSGIDVVAEVVYRPPAAAPVSPFTLDLADVFAFLDLRAPDNRTFLAGDLVGHFAAMIDESIVVLRERGEDSAEDARTHRRALIAACGPILLIARELQDRYVLAAEAPASTPNRAADENAVRTLVLTRPLTAVLEPLARRYSTDAFVSAVSPSRDGGFESIGARLERSRAAPPTKLMASFGADPLAMTVALRTGRATKLNATALSHSGLAIRPSAQGHWALEDLVAASATSPMPVVDDAAAPIWRDRTDSKRYWYAPEIRVAMPAPQALPATSPFLFSFRTVGHDAAGKPGLEATVRLRLRATMSSATEQAWVAQGKPNIGSVPLNGLAASLEIPFRDPAGRASSQAVRASSVTPNGNEFDVTFVLTDQWARLAYGALAFSGFQELPMRVSVSWVFPAAVRNDRASSAEPARSAGTISVMRARPIIGAGPTIHFPQGPVEPGHPLPNHPLPPRPYLTQTQGRTSRVDVQLPCNTFGALYVQTTENGEKAIGCQDAFKLGVVELKLFEPIAIDFGGNAPPFQVLRSLQVPGRFLVVPTSYAVARFEPGDSRAFRPALFLFASVDAVDRDRTRCVVMATLEPAVSGYWRDALIAKLESGFHPKPELIWPSDLDVVPSFEWALTSGGPTAVEASVVTTPEGFQVSLATGVDGVLILESMIQRSGVMGSATYPLPDGSKLKTSLIVDLAHVSGPFVAGPIAIEILQGKANLTNKIEQPVDVGVLGTRGAGTRTTIPVEKRLEPGASTTVALPSDVTQAYADALPVGGVSSFEEIRTYVEDIYVSAVFVTTADLASLGSLSLEARVAGVAGSVRATLTPDTPRAEVTLLLPLTTYVAQPTLQFSITRNPSGASPVSGPWRDWRLDTLGSVVEIKKSELP